MSYADTPARELALNALVSAENSIAFIEKSLNKAKLSGKDYSLAREIAYGTMRRKLSLQYIAEQLSDKKRLKLKVWEKYLILMSIYQKYYMDKIPDYAVVGEAMKIAKKRRSFKINFLGAILNKVIGNRIEIPEDLSIKYSYPQSYIDLLSKDYSKESVLNILQSGNDVAVNYARVRNGDNLPKGLEWYDKKLSLAKITDNIIIINLAKDSDYYIQDYTPVALVSELLKEINAPKNFLDLCAAPGGKALIVHDLYPQAKIYLNDVSAHKIELLQQNFNKYNVDANYNIGLGQDYPADNKFDLIIIDAPCSNSGTLSRRPEARWRLDDESAYQHQKLQKTLIQQAKNLLNPDGHILYMTCSIISIENEAVTDFAREELGLKCDSSKLLLPSKDHDGGYGALLSEIRCQ